MNDRYRLLGTVLILLAMIGGIASAQTRTGSIDGTVVDTTGQVLPGVSITIEGGGLVSARVTATSGSGTYRFPALPPGIYTMRFELSGFRTVVNEGARVEIGRNTAINLSLDLSSVEETVTVVGESPMVDTKSTVIGASFDNEMLENVPSARDVWSLLEHQAPGVTTSRLDVGGSETGLQAVYSARGTSWQQNSYYLNGVNVTCPAALGASGYYYDYDSFEEVQVETGSHPASVNAPGVFMNMVTKSGGNEFRGGAGFYYQSGGTQSDNLDDDLIDRGASSAAFDFLSDANVQLGGPIVRDKSSFYASFRDERVHRFVPGFTDDDGNALTEDTDMWQFLIKNTTQVNDTNRIGLEWHHMSYWKPNRGASGNRPPEATWIEDDTFDIVQAEWTSTLSDVALLDVRFSHLRVFFPTFQQPDVKGQAGQDTVTGQFVNARNFDTERRRRRYSYKADLTYFKENWANANHEFKFGFQYDTNPIINDTTSIDDVFLRFAAGVPDQVDLNNTTRIDRQNLHQLAFFVDDIITFGNRVTLKLGLRFDRYEGFLPAQESPGGNWVPARTFEEQRNVLDVANFAPRLALIYALDESGRTALKTSWGRYYHQFSTGFANFQNPNGGLSDRYEWNDLNGDLAFQNGEQGTLLNSQLVGNQLVDPDFLSPYTDEFTIGIERELSRDLAISATYSYRKANRLNDSTDVGIPFDPENPTASGRYAAVSVTDPGPDNVVGTPDDGGPVTVYNLNPEFLGQNQRMLTNPKGNDSTFNGFEVTVSKRMTDRWAALASYSYNNTDMVTRGGQFDGDANGFFDNPNNLINARGKSFYDRTNQFKFAGTYIAPRAVRLSGVIRAQTGQPTARTFTVSGLNQGTVTILAEPIGGRRLPNVFTADLTVSKSFALGAGRRARGASDECLQHIQRQHGLDPQHPEWNLVPSGVELPFTENLQIRDQSRLLSLVPIVRRGELFRAPPFSLHFRPSWLKSQSSCHLTRSSSSLLSSPLRVSPAPRRRLAIFGMPRSR